MPRLIMVGVALVAANGGFIYGLDSGNICINLDVTTKG